MANRNNNRRVELNTILYIDEETNTICTKYAVTYMNQTQFGNYDTSYYIIYLFLGVALKNIEKWMNYESIEG